MSLFGAKAFVSEAEFGTIIGGDKARGDERALTGLPYVLQLEVVTNCTIGVECNLVLPHSDYLVVLMHFDGSTNCTMGYLKKHRGYTGVVTPHATLLIS